MTTYGRQPGLLDWTGIPQRFEQRYQNEVLKNRKYLYRVRPREVSAARAVDTTVWRNFFAEGIPANIVNPAFGPCIIMADRVYRTRVGIERKSYLVRLVRNVVRRQGQQSDDVNTAESSAEREATENLSGYYEVNSMVVLPNGQLAEYIYPTKYVITRLLWNESNTGKSRVYLRSAQKITVMFLSDFLKSNDPNYLVARRIFQDSNFEFANIVDFAMPIDDKTRKRGAAATGGGSVGSFDQSGGGGLDQQDEAGFTESHIGFNIFSIFSCEDSSSAEVCHRRTKQAYRHYYTKRGLFWPHWYRACPHKYTIKELLGVRKHTPKICSQIEEIPTEMKVSHVGSSMSHLDTPISQLNKQIHSSITRPIIPSPSSSSSSSSSSSF